MSVEALLKNVDPTQAARMAEAIKAPVAQAASAAGMSRTAMILLGVHSGIQTGELILRFKTGGAKMQAVIKALDVADRAIMDYIANPDA